jgi:hypothetical protein
MKKITYGLTILFSFLYFSCFSQEKILVEEHFIDNSNKWDENDNDWEYIKVSDNKLVLNIKKTYWLIQEHVPFGLHLNINKISPFSIECKTSWLSGKEDFGYGIYWGYLDKYRFYHFDISYSGYYKFAIVKKGRPTNIIDWSPCDKINKKGNNSLMVKRSGHSLMLYINDQFIRQIEYSDLEITSIGFSIIGIQSIEFDDLIIKHL